jgi:hypothetical protein
VRAAFTGGCHSNAGVIGGATAAGCGAIAGGLVAGVSTRSAAAHGRDDPAEAGAAASGDASEIVGEVLDDSRTGDHEQLPSVNAGTAADGPGATPDDGDVPHSGAASPARRAEQPPGATWIGSRKRNDRGWRYRADEKRGNTGDRTPGSIVDRKPRPMPPPLS